MSKWDFSRGKGGRCVWLTTDHPCSAERQENPGPNLPGTPWATSACCGMTFSFTLVLRTSESLGTIGASSCLSTASCHHLLTVTYRRTFLASSSHLILGLALLHFPPVYSQLSENVLRTFMF